MTQSTDERGRIQLPEDVRERYGDRYHVVELPSHVALFPVDDDPLEGLREAVGDAFEDLDSDDVKDRALKTASRLAEERAERRSPTGE